MWTNDHIQIANSYNQLYYTKTYQIMEYNLCYQIMICIMLDFNFAESIKLSDVLW